MRTLSIVVLAFFMGCSTTNEPPTKVTAKLFLAQIQVDELKNELILRGEFESPVDSVVCDSMALEIISASDSILIARIPANGKGSCGEVRVILKGVRSNGRVLSMWHYYTFYQKHRGYPSGGFEGEGRGDSVHLRVDRTTLDSTKTLRVLATSSSKYQQYADGGDGTVYKYTGPIYHRGGSIVDTFIFNDFGTLLYDACAQRYMYFDNAREVVAFNNSDQYCGNQDFGMCDHGGPTEPAQFVKR